METNGNASATAPASTQIRVVEGIPISGFYDESVLRAALRYEPRNDEVYVAAYPKSGTTWVHFLVRRVLHQGHESPAESAVQCMLSSIFGYAGSDTPNAVIKTHLPFGKTPFSEKARYIYVLRNPYDCCVSYYHQRVRLAHAPAISFDKFLDEFIEGEVPFGDYFDHLAAWFPQTSRPNVICVPYEQLKTDVRSGVLRIADFLGTEYGNALRNDDEALEEIIQTTSPNVLRKHFTEAKAAILSSSNDKKKAEVAAAFVARGLRKPAAGASSEEKANLFKLVRKATIGDWRNHFSAAQAERMRSNMESKMAAKMAEHRDAVLALWKDLSLL
ncbi:sulfotransferase 1C2-like [Dermacentor variabilis]|uniref:sulfotransferase 1C2-like n=1 Tax=Dermacentor variabilis TaxID=34621 RepID=UPI003F5C60BA